MRGEKSDLSPVFYECIYFIYYVCVLFFCYLHSTMFMLRNEPAMQTFLAVGGIFIIVRNLMFVRGWKMPQLIFAMVIGVSFLFTWLQFYPAGFPRTYVFPFAAMIIGAHGLSGKKIMNVHFAVCALLLVITVLAMAGGFIENLVYVQASHQYKPRYAFGSVYPTDFAAHILFLFLTLVWIRGRKMTWLENAAIFAAAIFCFQYCDARTTCICLLLLGIGVALEKICTVKTGSAACRRWKTVFNSRGMGIFFLLIGPVLASLMIMLSYCYRDDSTIMQMLNKVLNGRLSLGREAFVQYNVKLFGQVVPMVGFGGTTVPPDHYFFLDCSYLNILFRFGPVVLFCLLACFELLICRSWKEKNMQRLFALCICLLCCCIEHHLIEVSYDPFPLLVFAGSAGRSVTKRLHKEIA